LWCTSPPNSAANFAPGSTCPAVLGELVGGVIVGVSALHLIVFPEGGGEVQSLLMNLVGMTSGLSPESLLKVFQGESEVISVLAELGSDHPTV
jgi:Kef-type K+ transport system membrane component KefB